MFFRPAVPKLDLRGFRKLGRELRRIATTKTAAHSAARRSAARHVCHAPARSPRLTYCAMTTPVLARSVALAGLATLAGPTACGSGASAGRTPPATAVTTPTSSPSPSLSLSSAPAPAPVSALPPITAAPPPRDDGSSAKAGGDRLEHAAALEELRTAHLEWRTDKQSSLRVLLPDGHDWLSVKFWSVPSLVGFRYGKNHHAIVGGFVMHVPDEKAPSACSKAFEAWAAPYIEAFDVEIVHDPPAAFPWWGKIVEVDSLVATTATLGDRDQYAAVYGAYPAWPGACLIFGVAVPARQELNRAKAVRDRFAVEVLPKLVVMSATEPKEKY